MTDVDLRLDVLNCISLCTGGGGLDRAFELAVSCARSILLVEREAFAIASLVAQIENGLLAPAAIWSDVRTVPGRRFRGLVDGVIGGIPCQEWSLAGQRRGDTGERDLWPPARRVIIQSGAWFCLIENVAGILTAGRGKMPGAERIRRDLRRLGFQVVAVIVRAADMGLPHERERVFILGINDQLAHRTGAGSLPSAFRQLHCGEESRGPRDGQPERHRSALANPSGTRRQGRGPSGDRSGECEAAERGGEFLGELYT